MRLYYFMYSNSGYGDMGVLTVTVGGSNVFSKSKSQGNGWKKAEFKLTMSGSKRVSYLAINNQIRLGHAMCICSLAYK